MLQAILTTDTGYQSSYIDILNNERNVRHSVVLDNEHKDGIKEEIVEELCRIFMQDKLKSIGGV